MKYAFSILSLSFFIMTLSSNANARSITSFQQSRAISAVAEFMYDVGEDIQLSIRLTDKKITLKDLSECSVVSADEILTDIESSIKKIVRFYPDEEVPFEEALIDLENYLDARSYKKCDFIQAKGQSLVKSAYYVSSDDSIHLRLDNITPLRE